MVYHFLWLETPYLILPCNGAARWSAHYDSPPACYTSSVVQQYGVPTWVSCSKTILRDAIRTFHFRGTFSVFLLDQHRNEELAFPLTTLSPLMTRELLVFPEKGTYLLSLKFVNKLHFGNLTEHTHWFCDDLATKSAMRVLKLHVSFGMMKFNRQSIDLQYLHAVWRMKQLKVFELVITEAICHDFNDPGMFLEE